MPTCPHCNAYSMHELGVICPACDEEIQQVTMIGDEEEKSKSGVLKVLLVIILLNVVFYI